MHINAFMDRKTAEKMTYSKFTIFCDQEHCIHEKAGVCHSAAGISLTSYSEYPDDMECNTFEFREVKDVG
jgi:hypothetical protein